MSAAPTWASVAPDYRQRAAARPVAERLPTRNAEDAGEILADLRELLADRAVSDKTARAFALAAIAETGAYPVRFRVARWAAGMQERHEAGSEADVDRATALAWIAAGEAVPASGRTADLLTRRGWLGVTFTTDRRVRGVQVTAGEVLWLPATEARAMVAIHAAIPLETPDP